MADKHIHMNCPACHGSGVVIENQALKDPPGSPDVFGEVPCERCEATGFLLFGELDADLITILEDVQDKVDGLPGDNDLYWAHEIWEVTDIAEFLAQSQANRDLYGSLMAMGVINLADGSSVKTFLWAMFPDGTTTRTALEALVA